MLGVFSVRFTGLRFLQVTLDLDLDLVSSILDLIDFFRHSVSSEGMFTISCSSATACKFFIFYFMVLAVGLRT